MAALDWSRCPAVESVPDRVGGAWVFKGTRLPVTARSRGWNTLSNGALLSAAEEIVGETWGFAPERWLEQPVRPDSR